MVLETDIIGWYQHSEIVIIFKIEIIMMKLNINMLFRNSENNWCFLLFRRRDEIVTIFLNFPLLFQTNNPNNIIIQNNITFTILVLIEKSLFSSLSSFTIFNSFILTLFFARSKHSIAVAL
jgi:hypothetical protein